MAGPAQFGDMTRVMVTYNSAEALVDHSRLDAGIVDTMVIDNGSSDRSIAVAQELGYAVWSLGANHGYGIGCNCGVDLADTPFVLIANPDVAIDAPALRALRSAADRYPDADLFVPAIVREDGSPFFRFASRLLTKRGREQPMPSGDACISTLSGAALLVRREGFRRFGGFDPAIFLYFEDDDLGLRCQASRRAIVFVPEARVRHAGNASSSGGRSTDRVRDLSFGWSWAYVLSRHGLGHPRKAASRLVWRILGDVATLRLGRARGHALRLAGVWRFMKGDGAPFAVPTPPLPRRIAPAPAEPHGQAGDV